MSVIPLAEAKKVYNYDEVIGQAFSIPIPRDREYTSLKERNGYRDQRFSSNDMPEEIEAFCLGITHPKYSLDGKIHPVCFATKNLINEFWLKGKVGFIYGPDELDRICGFFGKQEWVIDARSINKEDKSMILAKKGDYFWLASIDVDVDSDCVAELNVQAVVDGDINDAYILFNFNGYSGSNAIGVRPVFVLKSEVKLPEPNVRWVMS